MDEAERGRCDEPRLDSRDAVMAPLRPADPSPDAPSPPRRRRRRGTASYPRPGPLTLAQADQRHAHRPAGGPPAGAGLRRGRRGQGRRLRGDPRACASASAARRVFDTLLDEQTILGVGARHGARRVRCRSPRSSTSPTCTTPRTSCAARRPRCGSSPTASTATRWWCAIAGLAYQRGFGGHFHNDNSRRGAARHPRARRSPSPSHPADAPGLLRTCFDLAETRRPGLRLSSSRSRSTTPATCTRRATAAGPRRTTAPGQPALRPRAGPVAPHGDGATSCS